MISTLVKISVLLIMVLGIVAYTKLYNANIGPFNDDEIACGAFLREQAFNAGDRDVPSVTNARIICRDFIEENGPWGNWNKDENLHD